LLRGAIQSISLAMEDTFDFVIVGAGSSGCALANRLSANPGNSVALLEAGGKDSHPAIAMPAGVGQVMRYKNAHNWAFDTTPQPALDGRRLYQPRGRGWGGSSSINGMIYMRGRPADYDDWRALGLTGWGYDDVLPYFKRAEDFEPGADEFHGQGGPLFVSAPASRNPLFKAFIEAGKEAGYRQSDDFNGARQEGFGPFHLTIRDGRRWSAAAAYLHPALKRKNLEVFSHAQATRILFDAKRATGVEYAAGPDKPRKIVRARREVILAAGAFQSPHLLLLSGVGPGEQLKAYGIEALADSRDVGRNLQDHLDVSVVAECTKPITAVSIARKAGMLAIAAEFVARGTGIGRLNFMEAGAFVKTRGALDRPDVQLHFFAAPVIDHGRVKVDVDAFTVHACALYPQSRGTVSLASPDPFEAPAIDPAYLSAESDLHVLRDATRIARNVVAQPIFDLYRGPEITPGAGVRTDAEIDAWIRRTAETIYHPAGACRMGADDQAVTDGRLRVRGVEALRVVDASIMPKLIGGNTNAPAIMIAEKAAEMILG
jgi:choline dehydrogenase